MSQTLVQEINTPLEGNAGTSSAPNAPPANEDFSSFSLPGSDFTTSAVALTPLVQGGSGGSTPHAPVSGGGGPASLSLQAGTIGAPGSPQSLAVGLMATALGGNGDIGSPGTSIGQTGGPGGGASTLLNTLGIFASNASSETGVTLTAIATAGDGAPGGDTTDDPGFAGASGGPGGGADATIESSSVIANGRINVEVFAAGGHGGAGGTGGASVTNPGQYGPGGDGGPGGNGQVVLSGNTFDGEDMDLDSEVQLQAGGTGGDADVLGNPGLNGAEGSAFLVVTNNTITVGSPPAGFAPPFPTPGVLTLDLAVHEFFPSGASDYQTLVGNPFGQLRFQGNIFTGSGTSELDLEVANGGVTVDTAANTLSIGQSPGNAMTGFTRFQLDKGDTFVAGTGSYDVVVNADPDTIDYMPHSGNLELEGVTTSDLLLDFAGFSSSLTAGAIAGDTTVDGSGDTVISVPGAGQITLRSFSGPLSPGEVEFSPACFARGTRIATTRGLVPVEQLVAGDRLPVAGGATIGVIWTGYAKVALSCRKRHAPRWPICIRRHAFARDVPASDLTVSPDHAIWGEGVLIPARLLVNGGSIVEDRTASAVEYWHVELERHAVLFAEGLAAESYLDTGNRGSFAGGTEMPAVVRQSSRSWLREGYRGPGTNFAPR